MSRQRKGFTLVELSIVLVILGLLVGGVLTGQSLIRAAELRSISTQYSTYITAVQTFRDKYFALPGDMTNATAYWGIAGGSTGNDSTCQGTTSTGIATCNGNGDGKVGVETVNNENFRFWQHLANAGLIEGSYNGVPAAGATHAASKANVASGRMGSTLWFAGDFGTQSGAPNMFNGSYGNSMYLGRSKTADVSIDPFLKPEEAYNVDMKLDDGKPATGRVLSLATINGTATACTDGANSTVLTANYQLSSSTVSCAMFFPRAF